MAIARGFTPKAALSPAEKLTVAYFHLVRGIAQHDLASLQGVNPGRVAEAIADVRTAIGWPNGPTEPAGQAPSDEG
jgi:hypothetical protein